MHVLQYYAHPPPCQPPAGVIAAGTTGRHSLSARNLRRGIVTAAYDPRAEPPPRGTPDERVMETPVGRQPEHAISVARILADVGPVGHHSGGVPVDGDDEVGGQVLAPPLGTGMHPREETAELLAALVKPGLPDAVQDAVIGEQVEQRLDRLIAVRSVQVVTVLRADAPN